MELVAAGDTHQTATRVPEGHFSVRVESNNARQLLIGEVGANPLTYDLFRVSQFVLKFHSVLPGCGREPCFDANDLGELRLRVAPVSIGRRNGLLGERGLRTTLVAVKNPRV